MSRGNPDRCLDIIEAIGKIERYQTKLSGPDVEMAYDAIVRQLGIIGEAAKSLDSDSKAAAPEIEWHKIVGLRNVAIQTPERRNSRVLPSEQFDHPRGCRQFSTRPQESC